MTTRRKIWTMTTIDPSEMVEESTYTVSAMDKETLIRTWRNDEVRSTWESVDAGSNLKFDLMDIEAAAEELRRNNTTELYEMFVRIDEAYLLEDGGE